jgi:nicotinamide-nucleotide amidase
LLFCQQDYCFSCKNREIEDRLQRFEVNFTMKHNLNAEIISIGTEILLGELTDTNSVFMARILRDLGINLYYMTTVGDNKDRIADSIRAALSRAQIVITCGGLGPTVDDMTRQAVADATSRGLTFHQNLLDQIAARFAGFNAVMTENNRQQAYLPDNAIPVENPVGTAPSFIVEHGGGIVISLPGVPREMKFLLTEKIVPYLHEQYNLGIIKARTLKSAGIGESALDDLIGREILEASNPTVGLAAHSGQIDIRITAKADKITDADRLIADVEAQIRARANQFIFGADDDQLEDVLVGFLKQHEAKLAIVQAGIGDVITQAIQSTKIGEETLAGSHIFTNPDELRQAFSINQAETASLRDLAIRAVEVAREKTDAAAAIAIISLPDVDEDADVVEGTAIAVSTGTKVRSRVYGFGAQSEVARDWVRSWSLSVVWRMLTEKLADAD